MSRLGLLGGWIDRVMSFVTTPCFSVWINGKAYGNISPSRGFWQGDLLSPYLFLLCAKGFSSLLAKAGWGGFIGSLYAEARLAFPTYCLLMIHCYFVGLNRRKCTLFLKFYRHMLHHRANV